MQSENRLSKMLPVLFGFFIMGFVDVVGIATNYVKGDFLLNDKTILLFFLGILFVVGVDVGMNTTIPKILMERCG